MPHVGRVYDIWRITISERQGFHAQTDGVGIGTGDARHVAVYHHCKAAAKGLGQRNEGPAGNGNRVAGRHQSSGQSRLVVTMRLSTS